MLQKRRRSQRERTAESDRAMFRAATEIIAEEGLQGITLVKVGKLSGYSPSLVTYRYGSRFGLLKAVAEKQSELWKKILTISEDDIENEPDFLCRNVEVFLNSVRENNAFVLALLRIVNESPTLEVQLLPCTRSLVENIQGYVAAIVDRGKARQTISRAVDATLFAAIFVSTLRGLAMQYFLDPDSMNIDAVKNELKRDCVQRLCLGAIGSEASVL